MSRRLQQPIPSRVVEAQRRAADPSASVWVAANAGSGKTYVLTARVLRLLLSGVPPEQILCLTYTKAAAAEMRRRVTRQLGEWALLDDAALTTALIGLEDRRPDAAMLRRARGLFAHALETPGGLRIMTIHAFCESVLHRFPKEAGVPFDFTVLDDVERQQMIAEAYQSVIAGGINRSGEIEAVGVLFDLLSDFQIKDAIDEALAEQRKLRHVVANVAAAKRRLRQLAGTPFASSQAILTQVVEASLFPRERWPELFAAVPPDTRKTQRLNFSELLFQLHGHALDGEDLFEVFLKDGDAYARRRMEGVRNTALAEAIGAEHDRLVGLYAAFRQARLIERSEAMLDVLAAISRRYETAKRARSLLDFDDLIERLAALLDNGALGPWVRYKLDSGVTHILVDESQDTNAEQWAVVAKLAEEFFDGMSAVERPRTIFAVGDQKQSIFSFQGANPRLFIEAGITYAELSEAAKLTFERVPLQTSFRTLPKILDAVDRVFALPGPRGGIPGAYDAHDTARAESGGLVTLWPPVRSQTDDADSSDWPMGPPTTTLQSGARQVADRIASEIAGWLADGRMLAARGRAVRADDILILVQTRGELFREVIRALIRARIQTPGADRLPITRHIAVLDLMALGDVLSNPADDLQLAALLRSPLFAVSEDDLLAVAQGRGGQTLWSAMGETTVSSVQAARAKLDGWRARLDFERPFDFYSDVLHADGGLRRFHERLGGEVDDVVAEFLELALMHEQAAQPSLLGFLASLRQGEIVIKRELAEAGSGVRVMTVHGAKGLEAPVVILADAVSTEKGRTARSVFLLDEAPGPLLVHASADRLHVSESKVLKAAHEAAQQAEYWRKLYVGMTRAEDELYVTGSLGIRGKLDGTWYEAIETALRPEAESITSDGVETALVFPRERPATAMAGKRAAEAALAPLSLPPLPTYRLAPIVRPSQAADATGTQRLRDAEAALDTAADTIDRRDPEQARQEGVALHALLQHLSRLAPGLRDAVARKAMPVLLPGFPNRQAAVIGKAHAILGRLELHWLFGSDSRAEVPMLAHGRRNGAPALVAGRIDRLVVTPERVSIVDFKSDAVVPKAISGVPAAYLTQLGLYAQVASQLFPGRQVEAGILWTGLESLMILPAERLREATQGFTMG